MSDASNVGQPQTNAEIRLWYRERVAIIPELNREWITQGFSVRERAERAWRIRHEARLEARSMMTDVVEVELLRARDVDKYGDPDGPTFEFFVKRLEDAGHEGDAVYEAIIERSSRIDIELNRRLGL